MLRTDTSLQLVLQSNHNIVTKTLAQR